MGIDMQMGDSVSEVMPDAAIFGPKVGVKDPLTTVNVILHNRNRIECEFNEVCRIL